LLGSGRATTFTTATVPLDDGDLLALYTDGLVRGPADSDADPGPMVRALRDLPVTPDGAALPTLLDRLRPANSDDDACVLLVYPTRNRGGAGFDGPAGATLLLSRAFDRASLDETRRNVLACGADQGLTGLPLFNFTLAVTEVVTNAVRHGGSHGHLRVWRAGTDLLADVTDQGDGIPAGRRATRGPQPGQVGGWGLWLARQICTTVDIDSGRDGTRVRLCFPIPAPEPGQPT
jgi:anti-sigma regulatory factor (Ser/Thr protein kinase)